MRAKSSASPLRCLAVAGSLAHLAAAASSAGCSADQGKVKTDNTSSVDLGDRNYLLYIPKNYQATEPAPLILSYHGGARDAQRQQALDQFNTPRFNKDYIVAYPNSVSGYWQGSPGVDSDDVGFTKQILDQLEEQYCVDTDRIYATGKSQGGGMVGLLAADADLSMRFAAFAPVSGAFYVISATSSGATVAGTDDKRRSFFSKLFRRAGKDDDTSEKTSKADRGDSDKSANSKKADDAGDSNSRAQVDDNDAAAAACSPASIRVSVMNDPTIRQDIPILEIHGKADDVIPYDGGEKAGGCLPAIEHWVQSWALANGLDATANTTGKVPGAKGDAAVMFQFGSADAAGRVTHIMSGDDIGHDWPSTEKNEDNELPGHGPASFNASSVIMDFFETYRLGVSGEIVGEPQASLASPSSDQVSPTPIGGEGIASGASKKSNTLSLIAVVVAMGLGFMGLEA